MTIRLIDTRNTHRREIVNEEPMGGLQPIHEVSEMGETLKQLNDDTINEDATTAIDMRSRLFPTEVGAILAVDFLVSFQMLPSSCIALTRQKKRLAVSLNGLGRKEMVDMVRGAQEQAEAGSLASRVRSWMGGTQR